MSPGRIRGRIWRRGKRGEPGPTEPDYIEIDASELSGLFAAPGWLRDLGILSWLLVGIAFATVGLVWLLALTQVIVIPVITAAIIAAVLAPLVRWFQGYRIPRAIGAILVLLLIVVLGLGTFYLILRGVQTESSAISSALSSAADTISGWAKDLGVDSQSADNAKNEASSSVSKTVSALLAGLGSLTSALAGLVFFLAMMVLSLFFLLKDGPTIRVWAERHMGVPLPVARVVTDRVLGSLRGYFLGVTIVAAYNAVIIGGGAVLIGVPLAGTIAVVTFFASYVPYLGAWAAGAFAVLIALSDGGADAAIQMAVIALLANGILQQLVQPFAYGAALGIHPLAVLIVTIAGGAIFGTIGLVLAAPLTSAVTRISADLARARAEEGEDRSELSEAVAPAEPAGPAPEPAR